MHKDTLAQILECVNLSEQYGFLKADGKCTKSALRKAVNAYKMSLIMAEMDGFTRDDVDVVINAFIADRAA